MPVEKQVEKLETGLRDVMDTVSDLRVGMGRMETTIDRFESAFAEGMKAIGDILRTLTEVTTKIQFNAEQHGVIHMRIDKAEEGIAAVRQELADQKISISLIEQQQTICLEGEAKKKADSIWPEVKKGLIWMMIVIGVIIVLSNAKVILDRLAAGAR